MKGPIELILIISFACFGIASALTTFLGVLSVLESFDLYLKYGLAALIAIATSGVMLYIGFSIPRFRQDGKIVLVVLAYFVIASMSIFFNFVTFYQGQIISRTVDKDLRVLNSELTMAYNKAIFELKASLDIEALRDSVATYEAKAKSEEYNVLRPGKDWRWQDLKEKLDLYEAQLQKSVEAFEKQRPILSKKYDEAKEALALMKVDEVVEEKMVMAEKANKKIDEINAITQGLNPSYKYSYFYPEFLKIRKPDYMMQVIVDAIANYDEIEGQERTRFGISMFLSILLDIPIFITLLLIGSDMSVDKPKAKNVWS